MADIDNVIIKGEVYTNLIEQASGLSVNYKEATQWYDGTAMNDAKCDGDLYTKKGTKYLRKVIDKDGELFLEKDTMADTRTLSAKEILYLKAGVYRGVKLNGYYAKGDTPTPIEYKLSTTSATDDGGSVIVVGGIKLEHEFKGTVSPLYFGLRDTLSVTEQTNIINNVIKTGAINIEIPKGNFQVKNTQLKSNISIVGVKGETTLTAVERDALIADQLENITIKGLHFKGISQDVAYRGLWFSKCENIHIDECKFTNGENGVRFDESKNIRLTNNDFSENRLWGNYIFGCEDVVVSGNISYGNGVDGIKVAGTTDINRTPVHCKNIIISNNICYNNTSDGIDVAVNTADGIVLDGNILRDNTFQGIDFKILSEHQGGLKNCKIINNSCIGNINVGINCYNQRGSDSYYQIIVSNNYIYGFDSVVINDPAYGMILSNGSYAGNFIECSGNIIKNIEYGIRCRNINNATINNNSVSSRRSCIYLWNAIADETINNNKIYSNNLESTQNPAISLGTETLTFIGTASGNSIYDNRAFRLTGTGLRIYIDSTTTNSYSYRNIIAQYSGVSTTPSFASNKGDLVEATDPITRGFQYWISLSNQVLDTKNYGIVDKVYTSFFAKKVGTTAERPTLTVADEGFIYYDTTINRPVFWRGALWLEVSPNATTTVKGLVNQSAKVDDVASLDATDLATAITLINELKAKLNAKLGADRTSGQQMA